MTVAANVVSITSEDIEKSAERLARDAKLADAFRDMDGDLIDLRHMASIAFEQASETVHELYSGHISDKRHLDRVLFAVGHVEDMINDLYRKWDDSFHERRFFGAAVFFWNGDLCSELSPSSSGPHLALCV